jgi:hypothetical protein
MQNFWLLNNGWWLLGCQIIPLSVPLKNSFVFHSTENAFSDNTEDETRVGILTAL